MRRVFPGLLPLVMLGLFAPACLAARLPAPPKTIKDLFGEIPLAVLQRSVGPKFYRSLLVSALHDWNVVRAQVAGARLSRATIIRRAANPAYDSLALKFANDLTLVPNQGSVSARQGDSALVHLLVYQIADGVMAVSFAYPEAPAGEQLKTVGTVRLSVKTKNGLWTEIKGSGSVRERGRRLRRIDRMPMDVISTPAR
jgi:hypothetical protein